MTDTALHIVRYTSAQKKLWDAFVPKTRNGTFLFCRDYMDYHADRFEDHSLLFYKGKTLLALLPGHRSGDAFCSHCGLTYGGFLLSHQATTVIVMEMFQLLCRHLEAEGGVRRMVYRTIPSIYHRYPAEEDLYALFRLQARLTERKISSVIKLKEAQPFRQLRLRKLKLAHNEQLTLSNEPAFDSFWPMLEANLQERHEALPVHSLEEMQRLHHSFPKEILLFQVLEQDTAVTTDAVGTTVTTTAAVTAVAGCILYLTGEVAHVQYIASTERGRKIGALDFLFDCLIHALPVGGINTLYKDMRYKVVSYFDFGTSVEQGGCYLNEGLIFQKEGFGARAVVYDTYELTLPPPYIHD